MKLRSLVLASVIGSLTLAPAAVLAVDYRIPAKSQSIKQDSSGGFVAKTAKRGCPGRC